MVGDSAKTGAGKPAERPSDRGDSAGEGAPGIGTRVGVVAAAAVALLTGIGLIYWFAGMVFMD